MATRQFNRHSRQLMSAVVGLRFYMSVEKWEVLSTWTISMGLVSGGIYAVSMSMSLSAVAAFGSAGVVNIKIARIARYFAAYERPPPQYQDEWAEYEERRRNDK